MRPINGPWFPVGKVKVKFKDRVCSVTMGRLPLSQEEAGEAEQRALHKAAKDAKQKLKKQRESAYEDDGFEDPVHYDTDNQIQLPSGFLKHILR